MNTFAETTFTGQILLGDPASAATHAVRYGEVVALLSGTSREGHTHLLADLTDWTNLGAYVAAILQDTPTFHWQLGGGILSGTVVCAAGGGVVQTSSGLALDLTGLAAEPEHTHLLADITDLAASLPARVYAVLSGTDSISWTTSGATMAASVRRKTNGGLLLDTEGLSLDFGLGYSQVARGNHTHGELHGRVTLLSGSSTMEVTLNDQQLGMEVRLDPVGGLTVLASGTGCAFGTGHNQVARGDHTHAQLHAAATAFATPTLALSLGTDQVLSGTVRYDLTPDPDRGKLAVGDRGLSVVLGTAADEAAAGNHTHPAATTSADGFLAAADKAALDAMAVIVLSGTRREETVRVVLDGQGQVLLSGTEDYFYAPYTATVTGWTIFGDTALGQAIVDVRRVAYADFPPDETDSMAGTEKVTLLSGTRLNRNLSLATWDPELSPGDVLAFHLVYCRNQSRVTVQLHLDRQL